MLLQRLVTLPNSFIERTGSGNAAERASRGRVDEERSWQWRAALRQKTTIAFAEELRKHDVLVRLAAASW